MKSLVAAVAVAAMALVSTGAALAAEAKRVLLVATSHSEAPQGRTTGLWLSELTDPYWVFRDAGLAVDIVSIRGGAPPIDPRSGSAAELVEVFRGDQAAVAAFTEAPALETVDHSRYDAIFLAGGHGTMWDFVDNPTLTGIVSAMFQAGKPVAGVCHGPAGFLGATDANGRPIVEGRQVTGFTNLEERAAGWTDLVPFLLEDRLVAEGATFDGGMVFMRNTVRDGTLISGQNPASADRTAELVLEALGVEPRS